MDPYDRSYSETPQLFGEHPEPALLTYLHLLDPDRPVLDIGAGQGRNTLAVARAGLQVHALDPSRVGLATIEATATREQLPIVPVLGGFANHHAADASYGGVLAFGLIPDLPWELIDDLVADIRRWLAPGGLAFATGFTTDDPAIEHYRREWTRVSLGSFVDPSGIGGHSGSPGSPYRTYLLPGQALELFEGLEVLRFHEGLGPEHRHGDGPPERHARFEIVVRRTPHR